MHKLIKNLSFYSFGEILNKSIQFLLLPLYAHYLVPSDYGKLELIYLYGALMVIFYGFVIENGYIRLYFDSKETTYRDTLFGTSFFFKVVTGSIFLFTSLVLSEAIASGLFNFENGAFYIKLISISIFIKSLSEIPLKRLIVERRAGRYVVNNLIYLLISIISTIYFVVFLNLNISGVLYGQILGASMQMITLMYTEWKRSFFSFSILQLKGMLYFSFFLIPSQLSSFITYWSNRLFLQKYANMDDLGTFSFGYKIASVIPILLTGPIKKAIAPEIYDLIDRPEECKKKIRLFTLMMFIILTLFSLALSMFSKELIGLMAPEAYASSHEVVFILSMGYVIIGLSGVVVVPIQIRKKTWLITITWILSSAVNILLNYILVPVYGKAGATYATLLSFLFILSLYFIFAELVYRVRFEYLKYLSVGTIIFISFYVATGLRFNNMPLEVAFKFTIYFVTSFILFILFIPKEGKLWVKKKITGLN